MVALRDQTEESKTLCLKSRHFKKSCGGRELQQSEIRSGVDEADI